MLTIKLQFLAGRYHATPWGRNVNEGEVEWPPSPYRLARAIVDVWKRKFPDWPQERVFPILAALGSPAQFYLPPATAAHIRTYQNTNERKQAQKQLVFDAFVAVKKDFQCIMGLDTKLPPDFIVDFNVLLDELNYLGRSESWIKANIETAPKDIKWNCFPAEERLHDSGFEYVRVACCFSPEAFNERIRPSCSYEWLQALSLSSSEILKRGLNKPPALQWIDYGRKFDALRPLPKKMTKPVNAKFRCAKYALSSNVLPRVQDTLIFADRIRLKLMGIHKKIHDNEPRLVSPKFSGKTPEGKPLQGHCHAFYVPLDEDGDGRIDHLLIHAQEPFDVYELSALDRLRSVWQPKGLADITCVLTSLSAEMQSAKAKRWISATPFVTKRHYRKGRGTYGEWLVNEILRECTYHSIPAPIKIEFIDHTVHTSYPIRWFEFTRNKKNAPPLRGHGCVLEFENEISGPVVLGAYCHYGLGLFVPYT